MKHFLSVSGDVHKCKNILSVCGEMFKCAKILECLHRCSHVQNIDNVSFDYAGSDKFYARTSDCF